MSVTLISNPPSNTNRLRTPSSSPKNSKINFYPRNDDSTSQDKCKAHLAEVYVAKKNIDTLRSDLNEKNLKEEMNKKKIEELDQSLLKAEETYNKALLALKLENDELNSKIQVLSSNFEYSDIIEYYEAKIVECNKRADDYFAMFTKIMNKLNGNLPCKEEVWRKAVKILEERIEGMEEEARELKKTERKCNARQKFFEKYSEKAGQKFEKLSKISKIVERTENKSREKDEKYNNSAKEVQKLRSENNQLRIEIENLKRENSNVRYFYNKVQPIIKVDWEEIRCNSVKALEDKPVSPKNINDYSNKNIVVLIDSLNSILNCVKNEPRLKDSPNVDLGSLNFSEITEDIKSYIVMILKKNEALTVNSYQIINLCCDLNEKLKDFFKKIKENDKVAFGNILNEIRTSCSKLMYEQNPDKIRV